MCAGLWKTGAKICITFEKYNTMETVEKAVAKSLMDIKAVMLRPETPFVWASGWNSPIYCDNRKILSYPEIRENVCRWMADIIKEKYPELTDEQAKEVYNEIKSEFFKVSGEMRGIPRYPKVGKLPNYEFQFKFTIMNMKVIGEERRIVGTERIQTEAGSFDCFIMEETISTKAMMMKEVEKIRSWYAYGIGLVKEITYDKRGKLISTMTLNEINR